MKQLVLFLWFCILGGVCVRASVFTERYNMSYITIRSGLPHNFVDDIYKDSHGFLWVSTHGGGLVRYDGYNFQSFAVGGAGYALRSNSCRNVYEDGFGRLWVTFDEGSQVLALSTLRPCRELADDKLLKQALGEPALRVYKDTRGIMWLITTAHVFRIAFDRQGRVSSVLSCPFQGDIPDTGICDIDGRGQVWIGMGNRLMRADTVSGSLALKTVVTVPAATYIADILHKDGEVWIATNNGLYRMDCRTRNLKSYFNNPLSSNSLSHNYVSCVALSPEGNLLAGTLKGINLYNKATDSFERLDAHSLINPLNCDFVNCLYSDKTGIWVGTEICGINHLKNQRLRMKNLVHDATPGSLSEGPVNAVYMQKDGTLWVGTVSGGLNKMIPGTDRFIHFSVQNGLISNNSVSAITEDGVGRVWVGSWGGGVGYMEKGRIVRFLPGGEYDRLCNFVGSLHYDYVNDGLWIGTNDGVFFYDLKRRRMRDPFPGSRFIRGCIGSIIDRRQTLWLGCGEGVCAIDLRERDVKGDFVCRRLKYKLDNPSSRIVDKITSFCETPDGALWLGSNGYGFYRRTVDRNGKEHFHAFTVSDGLVNNSVRGLVATPDGMLWITTCNGLSKFDPRREVFTNYTEDDGLVSDEFYWNATYVSSQGRLFAGSICGLSEILGEYPVSFVSSRIQFTRLTVGGQVISGENHYLTEDISIARAINLHERDKSFSIDFSALDYGSGMAGVYSYRLVGFDSKWQALPPFQHSVRYTNLPAGRYTFEVKYSGNGGRSLPASIELVVQPYFYKSAWFVCCAVLLAVLLGGYGYYRRIRVYKRRQAYLGRKVEERTHELAVRNKQLEELAKRVEELTEDKIAFFTNITHEFRTPLTLILGPVDHALSLSKNPAVIEQLDFIKRNTRTLLQLVNQLLDFRKVESGTVDIHPQKGNFLDFLEKQSAPFEAFASERNIRFVKVFRLPRPCVWFDGNRLAKVINNLLGNAVKFTPGGGIIKLCSTIIRYGDKPALYVSVYDNGANIPPEDADRIFEKFFQSKGRNSLEPYHTVGTGIGLYLCRRIVEACSGRIWLKDYKRGCSFRFVIPLPQAPEEATDGIGMEQGTCLVDSPAREEAKASSDSVILVVEDNVDMRRYLVSILAGHYRLLEAANGKEGLSVLKDHSVNLIVSDLMMPVMDGLEFSRRVKTDITISHIPFLMLTAKTEVAARNESYSLGVDAYLLKPFNEHTLLSRISGILRNVERYREKFSRSLDVSQLNMDEESADARFMNKVMGVLSEHYADSSFDLSSLCAEVGVSKSLLNKKLQMLAGQSIGQFIRNYRLKIAYDMILHNRKTRNLNITDIAWKAGFNDPKYFTRCFTRQYGVSPSSLMDKS